MIFLTLQIWKGEKQLDAWNFSQLYFTLKLQHQQMEMLLKFHHRHLNSFKIKE